MLPSKKDNNCNIRIDTLPAYSVFAARVYGQGDRPQRLNYSTKGMPAANRGMFGSIHEMQPRSRDPKRRFITALVIFNDLDLSLKTYRHSYYQIKTHLNTAQ